MFGVLTMHLARLVNHGHSFEGAEDIFNLLCEHPLQHSFFHWFAPQRDIIRWPQPKPNSVLSKFHLVEYNSVSKTATAKYHSKYGTDTAFDVHKSEGLQKQSKKAKGSKTTEEPKKNEKAKTTDATTTASADDAWKHIIRTTFSSESLRTVAASHHSTIPSQERKITNARDKMTLHNNKVLDEKTAYYMRREENGVFCCTAINREAGTRCMSTFGTIGGRERHLKNGKHRYPTSDLKAWVHDMHLGGRFAFSLATGSMTNRCNFMNQSQPLQIEDGRSTPLDHDDIGNSWFERGCYRKRKKDPFSASPALKIDLETLFMAGFINDGPKKGANKYTPEQALAFLLNLKLDTGRRKYSPASNNGPLPTTSYIRSWFSRRKKKMANEMQKKKDLTSKEAGSTQIQARLVGADEDDDCISENEVELEEEKVRSKQYSKHNVSALKTSIQKRMRMSSFSAKNFYAGLLEIDDKLSQRERATYGIGNSLMKLQKLCVDRGLPSDTKKPSLIQFLLNDDKATRFCTNIPELSKIILQHEEVEEAVARNNTS